ncbi:MAG: alpha/beta hydrolase [Flavobacteriales bacterium]|nr:alpha/beta hydrolase [Flavobacteriales bacterium]
MKIFHVPFVIAACAAFSGTLAQGEHCIADRYAEVALFDSTDIEIDYLTTYAEVTHYFTGQAMTLEMDIYYPSLEADPGVVRPFILLVHGGSWFNGNKVDMAYRCMELARRGYVAATIEYRLGWNCDLNNIFTACNCNPSNMKKALYMAVQDTRAALRYVYNNAATWQVDTNWMFTGGDSAGSFNAMLAATWSQSEADSWLPGFSTEVGGLDESGNEWPAGFNIRAVVNNCGAVVNLSHLDDNTNMPMLHFHDSNDCVVPYSSGPVVGCLCGSYMTVYGSSVIHANRMADGECSELHTVPNSLNHCSFPQSNWIPLTACFLKRTMCDVCVSFSNTDIWTATACSNLDIDPLPQNDCPTDLNGDGITNIGDLLIFVAQFGLSCP